MQHPDLERLALSVIDPGSGELDDAFRDHLARCEACRLYASKLARIVEDVALVVESERLFSLKARAHELVSFPHELELQNAVMAVMIEETTVCAGVRSTVCEGRILLFEAGEYEIHLQVQRAEEDRRVRLLGQIFTPSAVRGEPLTVRVLAGSRLLGTVDADQFGQFEMEMRQRRTCSLEISGRSTRIRTPPITL